MSKTKTAGPNGAADPDELLAELDRRAEGDAEAYRRLVLAAAGGQTVAPEEAEATLAAAGRGVDEFRQAVRDAIDRRRRAAELARIPELEANLLAARRAVADRQAENERAVAALAAELRAVVAAEGRAAAELLAVTAVERELAAEAAREEREEQQAVRRRLYGTRRPTDFGWKDA